MKRNLIFVSCLALLLSACSLLPSQSPEVTTVEALTGGMTLIPTHNQDGIPYCKPYLPKPLQTGDVIKIDDVVEKCTFYSGTNYYHTYSQGSIHNLLYLNSEGVFQESNDLNASSLSCYGIELMPLSQEYNTVEHFILKHEIHKKNILNSFFPIFTYDISDYLCEQNICTKLIGQTRGENDAHYFLVGKREDQEGDFLLLDDTIYNLGTIQALANNLSLIKESPWIIQKLDGNQLHVARILNGELLEPYRSNPLLLSQEDFSPKVAQFQIQECVVNVKTP